MHEYTLKILLINFSNILLGAIGTYFTVTRDNVHAVHFNCTGDEMSLLMCSNSKGQTCNNSVAFVGCQGN